MIMLPLKAHGEEPEAAVLALLALSDRGVTVRLTETGELAASPGTKLTSADRITLKAYYASLQRLVQYMDWAETASLEELWPTG